MSRSMQLAAHTAFAAIRTTDAAFAQVERDRDGLHSTLGRHP